VDYAAENQGVLYVFGRVPSASSFLLAAAGQAVRSAFMVLRLAKS
jgi:hypothetical protein